MDNLQIPIEIPDVRIEKLERTKDGDFEITVTSLTEGTICHKCGRHISKSHGYDNEIRIRHLSILGHKTFVHIRPKRYECPYCEGNPTTTQKMTWYESGSPNTTKYERHVLLELKNSTVSDVCMKEDIGYEAVMGIIDRHIEDKVDRSKIMCSDTIGIDEISLKKGHKDFVTIITGGAGRVISAVLRGREKAAVKAFLRSIPKRLRKTLIAVCCDMYDGYTNAAKEVFGNKVMVVADRFHVAKLYRKDLDGLRKSEMKRLKKKLSEKEYAKLEGAMWALRKKDADLSGEEKRVLRILFGHSRILKIAYELCDELTDIFDQNISKEEAIRKIGVWMEMVVLFGLDCFSGFLSTLEKRMDEITNYFVKRHTSGFVEGLNNKIKVLKRRCYGIFDIKHLFQRIILDLKGYAIFS